MPTTDPVAAELITLNQRLLDAIAAGDWDAYRSVVAPDITCFEPEACGHLVEGLAFHEFYFKMPAGKAQPVKHLTTTMVAPQVRLLADDAAVVSYVRLVQKIDDVGKPVTVGSEETRVWQKRGGRWQHVHFHRSLPG
jgi:ketosteroid isomerase-like protein